MNHVSGEDLVLMALRADQVGDAEERPSIAAQVTLARAELVGIWPIRAEAQHGVGDACRRRYRRGGRRWRRHARHEHGRESNRGEIRADHHEPPTWTYHPDRSRSRGEPVESMVIPPSSTLMAISTRTGRSTSKPQTPQALSRSAHG